MPISPREISAGWHVFLGLMSAAAGLVVIRLFRRLRSRRFFDLPARVDSLRASTGIGEKKWSMFLLLLPFLPWAVLLFFDPNASVFYLLPVMLLMLLFCSCATAFQNAKDEKFRRALDSIAPEFAGTVESSSCRRWPHLAGTLDGLPIYVWIHQNTNLFLNIEYIKPFPFTLDVVPEAEVAWFKILLESDIELGDPRFDSACFVSTDNEPAARSFLAEPAVREQLVQSMDARTSIQLSLAKSIAKIFDWETVPRTPLCLVSAIRFSPDGVRIVMRRFRQRNNYEPPVVDPDDLRSLIHLARDLGNFRS